MVVSQDRDIVLDSEAAIRRLATAMETHKGLGPDALARLLRGRLFTVPA